MPRTRNRLLTKSLQAKPDSTQVSAYGGKSGFFPSNSLILTQLPLDDDNDDDDDDDIKGGDCDANDVT